MPYLLFILPNVDLFSQVSFGTRASCHLQQWEQRKQDLELRGIGIDQYAKFATHIIL